MGLQTHYPMSGPAALLRPLLVAALIAAAGLLSAVDALADSAPPRVKASVNDGVACFWRGHTGAGAQVMFRPHLGCLSSSCTSPPEQTLTVKVEREPDPEIALTTSFAVRLAPADAICTADCGGTGTASSTMPLLREGVYRVTLGGKTIGTLDTVSLEGDPFNRICMGTPET